MQARLMDQGQKPRHDGSAPEGTAPSPRCTPLGGIAFDASGNRLTPTHATKRGRRYRYYVSASLIRGGQDRDGVRVPAADRSIWC